jgi:DNA-binding MarR family transcriptional regulator
MTSSPSARLAFLDALVRAEVGLWNAADVAVTARCGISLALLTALRVVAARPGTARVQEVADDIGITVGAASKVVDRLERAELVRRVPHPADRRSSLLEVTDGGAAVLADGVDELDRQLARHTGDLSAGQLAELTGRLEQLRDATARDAGRAR